MFCYKCGGKLPDGAKFCKHCGANLVAHMKPVDNKPVEKPEDVEPVKAEETIVEENKVAENIVDEVQNDSTLEDSLAGNRTDDYDKTEIITDFESRMASAGEATEIIGDSIDVVNTGASQEFSNEIVPVNTQTELQVTKEKPKKRWPIVVLLLLIIFLSLGILGALFIFPDQVQEFVDRLTNKDAESSYVEDVEESTEDGDVASEGEEAEGEEQEEVEEATEWGKAYSEALGSFNKNTWPLLSMVDINGDDIPEIIGRKNAGVPGRLIMSYDESAGVNTVSTKGEFLTYSKSAGMIEDTYTEGRTAYDVIYELNSKGFEQIFEGSYNLDQANRFDSNGDPVMVYKADGMEVDKSAYYSNIESLYINKGIDDESGLLFVDYDAMVEVLAKADPEEAFKADAKEQELTKEWKYSFVEDAQYFVAPYTGVYRFALYGGNGGADKDRDYDEEAAVLIGTMKINAGERVLVFTGGTGGINKYYYDTVKNKGCVVPGGFNGGGDCFASGAGGGCTDIYYRGIRIAAAAGSGGGNYDVIGTKGRTSASRDHITSNKLGAATDKLDIGGGGAGWFGGTIGKVDEAGFGGVNGWDGTYFTMEQEFEGAAFSMSGAREGSAVIDYVGE